MGRNRRLCKRAERFFKDILSFDGKVDKGSSRKKGYIVEETKPLNVLNVYSDKLQMCIEQEMIEEKTNEITAIPEVIKRLNLKNVICTCDALNTQKENVKAVRAKGGDITYEYYQTEKVNWYTEKELHIKFVVKYKLIFICYKNTLEYRK